MYFQCYFQESSLLLRNKVIFKYFQIAPITLSVENSDFFFHKKLYFTEKVLLATKELEQGRTAILQIDFEVDTSLRDKFVNLLKKREERRQTDSQTASNKRYVA